MKFRQLQCLHEVANCGFNVSKAAAALAATQPAVGKQIRLLESELGVELLIRRAKRVIGLTDAGEEVLRCARNVLRETQNIARIGADFSASSSGSMSVVTTHTHARYMLLPAVRAFVERYPAVELRLQQGAPERIVDVILAGGADVGVITSSGNFPPGVGSIACFQMKHSLVVPAGHPLLRKRRLTLESLAQFPIIARDPAQQIGAEILRRFHEAGLRPKFVVQALDSDVMKTYVEAGIGIAVIPKLAFSPLRDKGLRSLDVSHLFGATTTFAIFRSGAYLNVFLLDFIQLIAPHLSRRKIAALASGAEVPSDALAAPYYRPPRAAVAN